MNGEGFVLGGVFVIGPGDQVEERAFNTVSLLKSMCLNIVVCFTGNST